MVSVKHVLMLKIITVALKTSDIGANLSATS